MTVEARTTILSAPFENVGEYYVEFELWSDHWLSRKIIKSLPHTKSRWHKHGPPRLVLPLCFPLGSMTSPEQVLALVSEYAQDLGPGQKVILHQPITVYPDYLQTKE